MESFDSLVHEAHKAALRWGLTRDCAQDLVRHYGTGYKELFELVSEAPHLAGFLPGTGVLRAEVVHAVRMEMALTLSDVVHRRTDLGLSAHRESALQEATELMRQELGWSGPRSHREVKRVSSAIPEPVTG
jgi:glycerol-3-phosphate dehydrogenase